MSNDDKLRYDILRAALIDMGILSASAELPEPYFKTSGVAGLSHVWFLLLRRPNGGEMQIVAKFDEESRARREWERIEELRNLNTPLQAMLPLPKNKQEHGVVVYQNANALTLAGEASTLQVLLRRQLATNPDNCLRALELSLAVLRLFYGSEPGALCFSAGGRAMKWTDWLPPEKDCNPRMQSGAGMAFPSVTSTQTKFTSAGGVSLPNPLLGFWERAVAPQSKSMVSRIHGDLNLSNILVGLSPKHAPVDVFLIDLAACQADAPTAIDLARIETEFWHEVFPALVGDRQVEMSMVGARNLLDLGTGQLSCTSILQNALRFVDAIRRAAIQVLGGGRSDYVLADYMQALYFLHGRALAFPSVQQSPAKCKTAFLGAALALKFLNLLESGEVHGPPILEDAQPQGVWPQRLVMLAVVLLGVTVFVWILAGKPGDFLTTRTVPGVASNHTVSSVSPPDTIQPSNPISPMAGMGVRVDEPHSSVPGDPAILSDRSAPTSDDLSRVADELEGLTVGELQKIGAKCSVGLSPGMDKDNVIAYLLNWGATKPDRLQKLQNATPRRGAHDASRRTSP